MQRGVFTTRVALKVIFVHIDRSKFICGPLCFLCQRRTTNVAPIRTPLTSRRCSRPARPP